MARKTRVCISLSIALATTLFGLSCENTSKKPNIRIQLFSWSDSEYILFYISPFSGELAREGESIGPDGYYLITTVRGAKHASQIENHKIQRGFLGYTSIKTKDLGDALLSADLIIKRGQEVEVAISNVATYQRQNNQVDKSFRYGKPISNHPINIRLTQAGVVFDEGVPVVFDRWPSALEEFQSRIEYSGYGQQYWDNLGIFAFGRTAPRKMGLLFNEPDRPLNNCPTCIFSGQFQIGKLVIDANSTKAQIESQLPFCKELRFKYTKDQRILLMYVDRFPKELMQDILATEN